MSAVWLGVTGNIGSGKSTVTAMLVELGAAIVDADLEAHQMAVEDYEYRAALTDRFGEGLFRSDGLLDRAVLAGRLFGDPIAVSDFNAIVSPRLVARTRAKMRAFSETHPVVVLDGALIFEYGRQTDFQQVWLVVADPEIVRKRLQEKGLTDDQISRRRAAQWAESVKIPLASRVLTNNGDLEQLRQLVLDGWKSIVPA